MFNFIDFAAVIVFLVTMFDDSTQLVTVPRSSSDPIAELCRALVVLKRERYHIREVFKLSSDGHAEKVYWYGRSQYIEALNAPHHINENVSCYTDYASGMRLKTPCKLDYDTHRVFDIVAPCNDEEDDVVVKRSILLLQRTMARCVRFKSSTLTSGTSAVSCLTPRPLRDCIAGTRTGTCTGCVPMRR